MAGMSQGQLARLAGMHQSTLSRLEHGRLEGLQLYRLAALVAALQRYGARSVPPLVT